MFILLKADRDSCDGAFGRSLRLTADNSDTSRGEVTATRNFPKPRLQSSAFKLFPPTLVTGLNYRNVLILNKGDNR